MRENLTQQRPLVSSVIQHSHAAELERVSELLNNVAFAKNSAIDVLRSVAARQPIARCSACAPPSKPRLSALSAASDWPAAAGAD